MLCAKFNMTTVLQGLDTTLTYAVVHITASDLDKQQPPAGYSDVKIPHCLLFQPPKAVLGSLRTAEEWQHWGRTNLPGVSRSLQILLRRQ
jgi:hypothetical protein